MKTGQDFNSGQELAQRTGLRKTVEGVGELFALTFKLCHVTGQL